MIIIFIFDINKNSLGVETCSSRSILVNIRLSKYRIWKATGLTTNCHVHHAFLYIYLLSLHDYNVKVPYFMRSKTQDNNFLFLFLNFDTVFRIQLQKH